MTTRRECLILVVFIIVSSITAFAHFNLGYSQQPLQTSKLVYAGGGNSTSPVVAFVPQEINIKAGESVTWDNPTPVAEPHSVSSSGTIGISLILPRRSLLKTQPSFKPWFQILMQSHCLCQFPGKIRKQKLLF